MTPTVCLFVSMILGNKHRVFFSWRALRVFSLSNWRSVVSSVRYKLNIFPVTSINFRLQRISMRFCYSYDFWGHLISLFHFPKSAIENAFFSRHWVSWCWRHYALQTHNAQVWRFSTRLTSLLTRSVQRFWKGATSVIADRFARPQV